MANKKEALKEYRKTSPLLKPLICYDRITDNHFVTIGFSKDHVKKRGFKIINVK